MRKGVAGAMNPQVSLLLVNYDVCMVALGAELTDGFVFVVECTEVGVVRRRGWVRRVAQDGERKGTETRIEGVE